MIHVTSVLAFGNAQEVDLVCRFEEKFIVQIGTFICAHSKYLETIAEQMNRLLKP